MELLTPRRMLKTFNMYKEIIRPFMKDVKESHPEKKSWLELIKIWLHWLFLAVLILGSWYFHNHYINPPQPIIVTIQK